MGEDAGRDFEGRWSLGEVGAACLGGIVILSEVERTEESGGECLFLQMGRLKFWGSVLLWPRLSIGRVGKVLARGKCKR